MVAWIKLFKYLSFNSTMTQLSETLSRAAKDLSGFSIMFSIIFFAFVQLGYLLFGTQVQDFRSLTDTLFTLFRMILGDFNFRDIERADTFLGPVYFLSYIFFVFFVLLNMFLAIINDTYGVVKADLKTRKPDFQMGDFFMTGVNNCKGAMGIHDRGLDVENAIKMAAEDDGFVTYDEIRENLRKARFSDVEIDIFFHHFQVSDKSIRKCCVVCFTHILIARFRTIPRYHKSYWMRRK
jgi:polycystin 2